MQIAASRCYPSTRSTAEWIGVCRHRPQKESERGLPPSYGAARSGERAPRCDAPYAATSCVRLLGIVTAAPSGGKIAVIVTVLPVKAGERPAGDRTFGGGRAAADRGVAIAPIVAAGRSFAGRPTADEMPAPRLARGTVCLMDVTDWTMALSGSHPEPFAPLRVNSAKDLASERG